MTHVALLKWLLQNIFKKTNDILLFQFGLELLALPRLAGLEVWFSLRVREVTGSIPVRFDSRASPFVLITIWSLETIIPSTISLTVKYWSQVRFTHFLFSFACVCINISFRHFHCETGFLALLLSFTWWNWKHLLIAMGMWNRCTAHNLIFLLALTRWIEKLVWFNSFPSVCSFEANLAQGLEHWSSKPGVRSFNLWWG